jgi:hypothetical protein
MAGVAPSPWLCHWCHLKISRSSAFALRDDYRLAGGAHLLTVIKIRPGEL